MVAVSIPTGAPDPVRSPRPSSLTVLETPTQHDGEPVFGWVWDESNECPAAAPRDDAVNQHQARRDDARPIEGVRQCRP